MYTLECNMELSTCRDTIQYYPYYVLSYVHYEIMSPGDRLA